MLSFEINNCVIIIFNKTDMLQMSKNLLNNFNLDLSAHCAAIYACTAAAAQKIKQPRYSPCDPGKAYMAPADTIRLEPMWAAHTGPIKLPIWGPSRVQHFLLTGL